MRDIRPRYYSPAAIVKMPGRDYFHKHPPLWILIAAAPRDQEYKSPKFLPLLYDCREIV
jgi:hypothetical protein